MIIMRTGIHTRVSLAFIGLSMAIFEPTSSLLGILLLVA